MITTSNSVEEKDIVIVGGGICGLATALALLKKGLSSVVLERAECVRSSGAGINIYANGWRALDQLGVGAQLRHKAIPIKSVQDISLNNGTERVQLVGSGELRSLRRIDLIETLADCLPLHTIRFGCHILGVKFDPLTSHHILQLQDGSIIKSKVVIGCDGVNSVVSELLGLKSTRVFTTLVVRGFTSYPSGHGFGNDLTRITRDNIMVGSVPVDDNLVYWFVAGQWAPSESGVYSKDPELIKRATVESIMDFPTGIVEIVKNGDPDSVSLTKMRYRTPWDILLGSFRKGTVTVAGDAMHAMAPFLGQGGSTALEDAIVLARNLAQELRIVDSKGIGHQLMQLRVGAAMDRYVKERRVRLLMLSTQTYLIGRLLEASSPWTKMVTAIFLVVFFSKSLSHTRYDCGRL